MVVGCIPIVLWEYHRIYQLSQSHRLLLTPSSNLCVSCSQLGYFQPKALWLHEKNVVVHQIWRSPQDETNNIKMEINMETSPNGNQVPYGIKWIDSEFSLHPCATSTPSNCARSTDLPVKIVKSARECCETIVVCSHTRPGLHILVQVKHGETTEHRWVWRRCDANGASNIRDLTTNRRDLTWDAYGYTMYINISWQYTVIYMHTIYIIYG